MYINKQIQTDQTIKISLCFDRLETSFYTFAINLDSQHKVFEKFKFLIIKSIRSRMHERAQRIKYAGYSRSAEEVQKITELTAAISKTLSFRGLETKLKATIEYIETLKPAKQSKVYASYTRFVHQLYCALNELKRQDQIETDLQANMSVSANSKTQAVY